MPKKVTAPRLREMKAAGERIVCLTAYDYPSAQVAEASGVDVVLVGDSLGNVVMGEPTTLGVTLEMVAHHVRAVRRGLTTPLLVADLPFGSYGASVAQAVESSAYLMKAGAEAVKLEGDYPEVVRELLRAGIPVMGHLGFTPQSVHKFGGFKVQGRGDTAEEILQTAQRLDEAGVCAGVLEMVPAALSAQVTQSVGFATIGIGAGLDCDGEIQVWHDVVGLSDRKPKHAKAFADMRAVLNNAVSLYAEEVRMRKFPSEENSF